QSKHLTHSALLLMLLASISGCQMVGQIVGLFIPSNLIPSGGGGSTSTYPKTVAWTPLTVTPTVNNPVRPTVVAAADMHLDGRPDIIAGFDGGNLQTPSLVIYFQVFANNNITWNQVQISQSNDLASLGSLAIADINGDGRPDIIAAGNGAIFFLRSPTDPTVGNQWQRFTIAQSSGGGLGQWRDVRIAQIDNQFQPDIVAANSTSNLLSFFASPQLVNGPDNMTGAGWTRFDIDSTTRSGAFGVAIDDVDADGRPDVVSTAPGEANARLAWYKNPSGTAMTAWTKFAIRHPRRIHHLAMC